MAKVDHRLFSPARLSTLAKCGLGLGLVGVAALSVDAAAIDPQKSAMSRPVTVDLTTERSWVDGYSVRATITNTTSAAIDGWTLEFNLNHTIEKMSRATYTGTDPYVVKPASYSANIAVGATEKFSFVANGAVRKSDVGGCTFNGAECTLRVDGVPVDEASPATSPDGSVTVKPIIKNLAPDSPTIQDLAPKPRTIRDPDPKPPAITDTAPGSPSAVDVPSAESPAAGAPASLRPKSSGPASEMLGKFNKSTDLLLLFHDNKPDPDDIHSQAAIGTMLRDPRFNGVKYHAVQGTIGTQSGTQLDSSSLF
ncbi:MAG: cellulose binding domain-containing protein, partial [Dermatophilaceae bacterium]